MRDMLDKAISLAVMAFNGRIREGEPDILHTLRVINNAYNNCGGCLNLTVNQEILTVAALHDVVEDTRYDAAFLKDMGFPQEIIDTVLLLTREKAKPGQSAFEVDLDYLDYIRKIRDSHNIVAIKVKLADLQDNTDEVRGARMKREQPERFERLQRRYALAKEILNGETR